MVVTGWKLNERKRARLVERFPPEWSRVIADHVTLDAYVWIDQTEAVTPLASEHHHGILETHPFGV